MSRKRSKLRSKHINFGRSTNYEEDEAFFEGKSAQQLIDLAFNEIDELGYNVVQRNHISPTTTMAITLWLGEGFPTYHEKFQAAVLWHEIVHARQWRDPKNAFPLRYINRRWQWAFEVQGYRQQIRVTRALSGDKSAKKMAYKIPGIMQKKPYTMRRLDSKTMRRETLRAFELGLPGLRLL